MAFGVNVTLAVPNIHTLVVSALSTVNVVTDVSPICSVEPLVTMLRAGRLAERLSRGASALLSLHAAVSSTQPVMMTQALVGER